MAQMGTCAHCNFEWYSKKDGKEVRPKWIPTCPEGEIAAICEEDFEQLPSEKIIELVQGRERGTRPNNSAPSLSPREKVIRMTPTEYMLVDTSIRGWVLYMKGEAAEPPFEQEALQL